jgi:hypothetical protein
MSAGIAGAGAAVIVVAACARSANAADVAEALAGAAVGREDAFRAIRSTFAETLYAIVGTAIGTILAGGSLGLAAARAVGAVVRTAVAVGCAERSGRMALAHLGNRIANPRTAIGSCRATLLNTSMASLLAGAQTDERSGRVPGVDLEATDFTLTSTGATVAAGEAPRTGRATAASVRTWVALSAAAVRAQGARSAAIRTGADTLQAVGGAAISGGVASGAHGTTGALSVLDLPRTAGIAIRERTQGGTLAYAPAVEGLRTAVGRVARTRCTEGYTADRTGADVIASIAGAALGLVGLAALTELCTGAHLVFVAFAGAAVPVGSRDAATLAIRLAANEG